MSRPAGDSRERLLKAGKALLQEGGLSQLSVRAVASRSGLNQGLVSYHFGGKQAFVEAVLQELYEDFFRDFTLRMEGVDDPLKALRQGLLALARFVRDHRSLVRSMVKDVQAGRPEAQAFAKANLPRHGKVLVGLIGQCMQRGSLVKRPVPLVMGVCISMIAMPTLMADVMMSKGRMQWAKLDPKLVEQCLLTDEALETRVDLALKALKP